MYTHTHTLHIKCMWDMFSHEIQWLILIIFNISLCFFKFLWVFLSSLWKCKKLLLERYLNEGLISKTSLMIFWIFSVKILSVSKFSDAVLKCNRWSNFKVLSDPHDSLLLISYLPFRFQLQRMNNSRLETT